MAEWYSVLWIVLSGVVFALFHSVTASQACKRFFYAFNLSESRYRLLYSIVSIVTTLVWILFIHSLSDSPLYQTEGVGYIALVVLQLVGVAIALAAFQPIDGLVFLGLKSAKKEQDPFIISGVYRYIRHPMYSGAMLILLAMPEQSVNGLTLACVVCAYFIIGSRFEEERMLQVHPEYAQYRQQVPAFIAKFRSLCK